jgi:hypothetical protein
VAIMSVGYDGTVTELAWAALAPLLGRDYAVGGAADLAVTAVAASGAREVDVAAGLAYGRGVLDTSTTTVRLSLPAPPSGQTRYHTIVMHRDWQAVGTGGAGGVSTITSVAGGTARTVASGLVSSPGIADDQVLALAKVVSGQSVVAEIIDLRARPARDVLLFTSTTRPGMLGLPGVSTGQLGYESDTGRLVLWSGAVWVVLFEDSGATAAGVVVDFTRWRSAGSSFDTRYRRRNGQTTLNAKLSRYAFAYAPSENASAIMTLPAAALPADGREVTMTVCEQWGVAKVFIRDGTLWLDCPSATIPVDGLVGIHMTYPSN